MIRQSKKEKIIELLHAAQQPVDVTNIQKECVIGNWLTALNYCLTLLAEGKIKGQRTSRGWVFWINQKIELQPYEEAIGTFEDLQVDENQVTLTLNINKRVNITFPAQSLEASILINALKDIKKGTKIALLRTDIPKKSLIIRTYETEATNHDDHGNTQMASQKIVNGKSPEILQKDIHKREAPKNKQNKHAPKTNHDRRRWRLILGSLEMIFDLVKIRGLSAFNMILLNFGLDV